MTVEQISGTTFVRALCSIPLHCVTGVFIGSGLARKKFFQEPWAEVTGFVSAVLIHGFYDFFLMFQAGLAEYVVTMEWDGKNPWVDYRMALRYLYLMGRVTPVTPLVITTALPWIFARREVTRLSSFPLINCRALRDARQTETPDCLCESLCPRVDPRFPFSARRGCTSVHTIVAKQPENWYTEILPWLKSGAVTQQGVETPLTAGGSLQGGGEVASLPNGASNSSGSPTGGGTYKTAPGPTLPGGSSSSQTGATSNPNPTTVVEPLEEP
uniref:PrsW family intramembrane metalloprotease n=1 Tax=Chromera velia CCMP2878 TaxID=1169474 RepID=A0A0G4I476_9ALVE|eukprot:Cvel_1770.t1-p1 / transcript=Cvel_1770.t1 / gene=Cvel_1770 / organism=Chromera_velia_CCMP2878 / gene_product=hypothetical protein / transcript_product=hypothetical protein / location=Cvel_scaffold65:7926-9997(+) / protein_length=269 / sequence_SO=supercontig / SO=protein_coding / is_pseudo=false